MSLSTLFEATTKIASINEVSFRIVFTILQINTIYSTRDKCCPLRRQAICSCLFWRPCRLEGRVGPSRGQASKRARRSERGRARASVARSSRARRGPPWPSFNRRGRTVAHRDLESERRDERTADGDERGKERKDEKRRDLLYSAMMMREGRTYAYGGRKAKDSS